jgi:hypothetical protein
MNEHEHNLILTLARSTGKFVSKRIENADNKSTYIYNMKKIIALIIEAYSLESLKTLIDESKSNIDKSYPIKFFSSYKMNRKYALYAHQHIIDIYNSIYGRFITGMSDEYSRKYKYKESIHIYDNNDIFEE